jgi:hypothetical protein
MIIIINNKRYGERGEEFKVLYYTSAVVIYNCNLWQSIGNLWQIASIILLYRYSLLTLATFLL